MSARLCLGLSFTVLLFTACSYNEQLRPEVLGQLSLSARDVREIRTLITTRSDIRKPLWGFYRDEHGRVVAQSGGNCPGDKPIGSFVTLVHRNGEWQIIKVKQGPVMRVEVSSILR
jgi:hypothetical protein